MPKPEVVPNLDMRGLPIGPEEAFVLSRVDGRSSEHDIVLATGLEGERVRAALLHLETLGAIRFPTDSHASPSPHVPARASQPVTQEAGDPADMADAELEPERQRSILEIHAKLDDLTHYELLGVDPTAEKKDIKEAYFRAVAVFHPDRYFGKNLGDFKARLERIFQRMTEAHDVLTRARARQEYDEYLITKTRNRAFEQAISVSPTALDRAAIPPPELGNPAASTPGIQAAPPPTTTLSEPNVSSPPSDPVRLIPSNPPITISEAPLRASIPSGRIADPDVRKRALARKLAGASVPPATSASSRPPDAAAIREKVAEDLRRHRDHRLAQAHQSQVRRYVGAAEQALAEKNLVSAANNFRIALSLVPDDPELVERLRQTESQAAAEQADSYLLQAEYEERHGKFAEAARAYERACVGRPSPQLLERAAACLVESKGDARKALDYARRAVAQAPAETNFRITLSRAFLHAGMRQSALGELERAIQSKPGDETIKQWIQRIKRHDV